MTEIVNEARAYANHCEACGQFTTAEKIRGLCDWIEILHSTNLQQKKQIAEFYVERENFRMKFKGGANHTSFTKDTPG